MSTGLINQQCITPLPGDNLCPIGLRALTPSMEAMAMTAESEACTDSISVAERSLNGAPPLVGVQPEAVSDRRSLLLSYFR